MTYSKSKNADSGHACQNSWSEANKAVVPDKFIGCLKGYFADFNGNGRQHAGQVIWSEDETKITAFRQSIKIIYIDDAANDGVEVLLDMRKMCNEANLGDTYSFSQKYFDFETYVIFKEEAILNVCLALVAVFVVLMVVTANFTITMFVLLCVALVDVFLFGLLTFWNITLNSVTVVNNVVAIGLAVDYSAHIGHAYLMAEAPDTDSDGNTMSNH